MGASFIVANKGLWRITIVHTVLGKIVQITGIRNSQINLLKLNDKKKKKTATLDP